MNLKCQSSTIPELLELVAALDRRVRQVQRAVTAQLIDASDARHIWSERYDREVSDVFAIQDEIGEAISTALSVRLAPPVKTANLEAYHLHLKGRYAGSEPRMSGEHRYATSSRGAGALRA